MSEEKKKELTDYDLDVYNSLKDFPRNKENSVLYIRGGINNETGKTLEAFVWTSGTELAVSAAIIPALNKNEFLRSAILNAVLNYLNQDVKLASSFAKNLKTSSLILR